MDTPELIKMRLPATPEWGGPLTADVHPSQVAEWRHAGWAAEEPNTSKGEGQPEGTGEGQATGADTSAPVEGVESATPSDDANAEGAGAPADVGTDAVGESTAAQVEEPAQSPGSAEATAKPGANDTAPVARKKAK